jgi:V8-like Glu-specific endopeptidase
MKKYLGYKGRASTAMFTFRVAAIFAITIAPARAADNSGVQSVTRPHLRCADISCLARADFAGGPWPQQMLHKAAVFSDDPNTIHDPRYAQTQTGSGKMFGPIGLIATNHPVPHQVGTTVISNNDMATAFLVSPCYILTNYHVVFGNRNMSPEKDRDYSMTFRAGGKTSRAVPEKYGEFYRFGGRDWALLRLYSDAEHPCLGEDSNIGWVQLAPLKTQDAADKSLSIAGYPGDKSAMSLWRQDSCHLFQKQQDIDNDGVWTTDCATRPRSSGSPIFFIQDDVLNVVAIMAGHVGIVADNEILPRWDPDRANLALDIGKIISSDPDFLSLIERDVDRFHQSNQPQSSQPEDMVQPDAGQAIHPEDNAQSSSETEK